MNYKFRLLSSGGSRQHLGVKLLTVPARAPAVFLITENPYIIGENGETVPVDVGKGKKRKGVNASKEVKVKYGVVLTDFTQADVSYYTNIGYDLVEKLPLPDHPLTSYELDEYQSLRGWFPREWMNDLEAFYKWCESHFISSDYADPETVDKVIEEVGWVEDLRKHGRIPPHPDDPAWQEKLKALWANAPPQWRNFTLPTAEEDSKRREMTKEFFRIIGEIEEKEQLEKSKQLWHECHRQKARREYDKKFGQRPSGPKDPEWRRVVDEVYASAKYPNRALGKSYRVTGKKTPQLTLAEHGAKEEEKRKLAYLIFHKGYRDRALDEYEKKFGQRPSGTDDPEWRQLVDNVYAHAPKHNMEGKSYEISEEKPSEKKHAKQPEEVECLRLSVQATTMTDTLPAEVKDEGSPATPQ
ncbi:hypothetical protein F5X68DRAFT_237745 [Plectosphaerella plurivora]|uniref:Uncharacterized protein n=1 Tax=Plectosphaerella plurivora TaxID=936078 RepID=A0A9P8UYA1_9PEZI|nr:hypothetical protein F5X68DRAFT_237745 [Plectosphaerella plurivora]